MSVIVRMEHVRALKYCARGVRAFFIHHGLDYAAFLQHGIEAEKLAVTGDAMAFAVIEEAQK